MFHIISYLETLILFTILLSLLISSVSKYENGVRSIPSRGSKAIQAIEPREGMDLTPFSYFETEDINRLNNIVNNIKVSK